MDIDAPDQWEALHTGAFDLVCLTCPKSHCFGGLAPFEVREIVSAQARNYGKTDTNWQPRQPLGNPRQ